MANEEFSYLLVVSVFLTPYSFSVTFFFPLTFVLFNSVANKLDEKGESRGEEYRFLRYNKQLFHMSCYNCDEQKSQ